MPRKLAQNLVKVKHNSMEGGAHFTSLFLFFKNTMSEEKRVSTQKGTLSCSGNPNSMTRVLKNRENPLHLLEYMKN